MASDGVPATPPVTGPVSVNQARDTTAVNPSRGKVLPSGGTPTAPKSAAAIEKAIAPPSSTPTAAASTVVQPAPSASSSTTAKAVPPDKQSQVQTLVSQLNKSINDSGRPDQYRLDTSAGTPVIQQINPSTGAVVGEYSEEEFPTLAQGLGVSGGLVDTRA